MTDENEKISCSVSLNDENETVLNDGEQPKTSEKPDDDNSKTDDFNETDEECCVGDAFEESREQPSEEELIDETTLSKEELIKAVNLLKTMENDISVNLLEIKKIYDLFQNWINGRLQKMQKEVDYYHDVESKRIFDDILLDITRVYCDNEKIMSEIEDEKVRKRVGYIFDDIEQLLESYDVYRQKSAIGEKRNTKLCKIRNVIETTDLNKHDTIANSAKSGFYKGNRILTKESVDIYLYREDEETETVKTEDIASDEKKGE